MATRLRNCLRVPDCCRCRADQIALISAPDRSSFDEMNSSRSTSSMSAMRAVWMRNTMRRVAISGRGNSILRSIRPGRIRAGSSVSMRLVAMMTLRDTHSDKTFEQREWLVAELNVVSST